MNVVELLRRTGGLSAVAQRLDVSPADAAGGAAALVPALLGGFARLRRSSADPVGEDANRFGRIMAMGGADLAARVLGPEPTRPGDGDPVLAEIFGDKATSRTIAANAGAASGIDAALLRRMLPLLAMLIAGYLAARVAGTANPERSAHHFTDIFDTAAAEQALDRLSTVAKPTAVD